MHEPRVRRRGLVTAGTAAVSASVLVFEIALTRVFAVTQFYHFAFLAVSLALLGFGASGSALSAFPSLGHGGPARWSRFAAAQAVTTLGAYGATNALPFDSFAIAWDRRQLLYLAIYYVALAVPFFFGGLVIGMLLAGTGAPGRMPSHHVYAASLSGSGIGCLAALWSLDTLGGERTVALAAAVAAAGAVAFAAAARPVGRPVLVPAVIVLFLIAPFVARTPSFLNMELSEYKGLASPLRYPGAEIVSTEWDRGTRVDHVRSDGLRSFAGLSIAYRGSLVAQDGITFDGDDLAPVLRAVPDEAEFASHLMASLPFSLRAGGDVLVVEPRGGLDVVVALSSGAASVTAVESLGSVVEIVGSYPESAYSDPRVTVEEVDARSFLARTTDRFDVIDLALTSPYRPVTSGAYSLAEDYSLTVEAIERSFSRLDDGGLLAVMRWAQQPPSEEIRLIATAAEALRSVGADPALSLVALRGYATVLVIASPDGITEADMSAVRAFARSRRFDLIVGPGVEDGESNLYNILPDYQYRRLAASLVSASDPSTVYDGYEFDISPPTDDRPFFGHFFKWSQAGDVLDTLGRTWQPFGGAGYFVLLALLAAAGAGSGLLTIAPLGVARWSRRKPDVGRGHRGWALGYFGLLGLAFLFVEIPLIQQYILLTGNATTALAVVLFVILLASGAGSLWSRRLPWRRAGFALAALVGVYSLVLRDGLSMLTGAPYAVRISAGALGLVPIGFLMGVMFPAGLAHLERERPDLVPWAWGINGTASVISGAASALLALSYGFSFVLLIGAAAYTLGALLARPPRAGLPAVNRHPG